VSLSIRCIFLIVGLLSAVLFVHAVEPSQFSVPCKIDTLGAAWNGFLAFGLFEYDPFNTTSILHSYLVVMNTDGEVVAIREMNDSSYFGAVKEIGHDALMFQGEPGTTVHFWNYSSDVITNFPNVSGHHDAEYNPVNNTFLTLQNYVRDVNGSKVFFDKIVEFDAAGEVLWSWDTFDYIPISEACRCNDSWPVNGERVIDLTHANTVQWDYENEVVYLNLRNLNTFYKINQTSGEIIWSCGEFGNFTLLNADGEQVGNLWYHSHNVRQIQPDVFIMFNNDLHNQTNENDAHSSILEITINEETMTAQATWEWQSPQEYWSTYWGDADRLSNGDRIGVFGTQTKPLSDGLGAVFAEVNAQGEVVRTYTFPRGWGVYRIEELSMPFNSSQTFTPNNLDFYTFFGGAISVGLVACFAVIYLLRKWDINGFDKSEVEK
jgi:hypothetical protein